MDKIDWKNKKVAVLGLGVEGLASAKFLVKKGARVTVLDRKKEEELRNICHAEFISASSNLSRGKQEIPKRVRDDNYRDDRDSGLARMTDVDIVGGKNYLQNLDKFDIIVRSPGVKRNLPEVLKAEKKGVIITSQTKIFFDLSPCPIIGVTGTKGKGTTATLIYEMLKKEKKDAYLGGNIGKPPFGFLDKLNKQSLVVLELSSFQLQDLKKSPHIAVVLMITSEHLDYHKDVYEYVDAKRNIVRFQKSDDFAIINKDYPASRESDILTKGRVFEVSREGEVREGCFVKEDKVQLSVFSNRLSDKSQSVFSLSVLTDRKLVNQNPKTENRKLITEDAIDIKDILLPGKHNLENVCTAVMAAIIIGVSKENIVKVLKTFKGLEHRLELVGEINGVKYYDDSFSTTPETAIAAIEAFESPEILILGGSSKGSDFTELGRVISNAKNIKAIIGIGEEWQRIKEQFIIHNSEFIIIEGVKDMRTVVFGASKIATPGDVVLLSPACASFDMFKNYKERGNQFKREILKLKNSTII